MNSWRKLILTIICWKILHFLSQKLNSDEQSRRINLLSSVTSTYLPLMLSIFWSKAFCWSAILQTKGSNTRITKKFKRNNAITTRASKDLNLDQFILRLDFRYSVRPASLEVEFIRFRPDESIYLRQGCSPVSCSRSTKDFFTRDQVFIWCLVEFPPRRFPESTYVICV